MNKKEVIDLLYKAIAYINGDINPTDRIVANSFYYVEPTETSGHSRCYINIIKSNTNKTFWYCSIITIDGVKIVLSKEQLHETEWLQGLFKSALSVKPISEVKFHDKWNEASKIIKQIQEL